MRTRAQTSLKQRLESRGVKSPYSAAQGLNDEPEGQAPQPVPTPKKLKITIRAPHQASPRVGLPKHNYLDKNLKQAVKTRELLRNLNDNRAAEDYGAAGAMHTPKSQQPPREKLVPALTNNLDEIYLSKLEDYDFKNKRKHQPNNLSRVTTGAHATERVKIINKASHRSP